METIMLNYITEILFGIVTAMFARVIAKLHTEKKERQCLKTAICALLRDRIIVIYNRYSEREYFPIYERENLEHLTSQYYLLGGNGTVKDLEAKLKALPTEISDSPKR